MIGYYLDENLPTALAHIGRQAGLDIECSHEVGNDGTSDEFQLTYAIQQRRCLVTIDRVDFIAQATRLDDEEISHSGILLVSKSLRLVPRNYRAIVDALLHYRELYPDGMDHMDWLRRVL